MLERFRDMLRSADTARILTRGIKAYREGEFTQARADVDAVVTATEHKGSHAQETHRRSMRLMAVALRAEIAARLGDEATARASIEEAFAMWEGLKGVKIGIRSVEAYAGWEKWARGWLAGERVPGP